MRLAVIPARGGSKRIPRKNIAPFAGKPMILWSIEAAKKSNLFDYILISTDDEEIARIAQEAGALVPFLRPKELADDYTPTVPVVVHAISWAEKNWGKMDDVCCIYATAPFITPNDICRGAEVLKKSDADYAFPVTTYSFPIQRSVRLTQDGRMQMLFPEHALTRSQDLEEAYHDVGQFYWGRKDAWLDGIPLLGMGAVPIFIERYRAQDIDTPADWAQAEAMFRVLNDGKRSEYNGLTSHDTV